MPDMASTGGELAAEELRAQISSALISNEAVDLLEHFELAAASAVDSNGARPMKRARGNCTTALPSDIDVVLQVYERTLEAMNAARFLKPLKTSADNCIGDDDCTVEKRLQELFCRWAQVADELCPADGEARLAKAWSSCGFLFTQMIRSKVSVSAQIPFVRHLFSRVSNDVPAQSDELTVLVRKLLMQWQFKVKDDPELLQFLRNLLREDGTDCIETGHADGSDLRFHDRISTCMKELLPSMWMLKPLLMPGENAPEQQLDRLNTAEDNGWFEKCLQPPEQPAAPESSSGRPNPVASPCRS